MVNARCVCKSSRERQREGGSRKGPVDQNQTTDGPHLPPPPRTVNGQAPGRRLPFPFLSVRRSLSPLSRTQTFSIPIIIIILYTLSCCLHTHHIAFAPHTPSRVQPISNLPAFVAPSSHIHTLTSTCTVDCTAGGVDARPFPPHLPSLPHRPRLDHTTDWGSLCILTRCWSQ